MIRIVSIALLLVAILAGSASAECAWVLWRQTITPIEAWTIVEAHPSVRECSDQLVQNAEFLGTTGYEIAGAYSGARMVPIRKDAQRGYLMCLPDTVDPRGLKGK